MQYEHVHRPTDVHLTDEDWSRVQRLTGAQTARFGHDQGYFRLGRAQSSHEYGFIGEVAVLRYLSTFGLSEPDTLGLLPMGDRFDVWFKWKGTSWPLHVKTGVCARWPQPDDTFGIHADQSIEESQAPVILVSALRNDLRTARIEGAMTAGRLGESPWLREGDPFPGKTYRSRTTNRLTLVGEYLEIRGLSDLAR